MRNITALLLYQGHRDALVDSILIPITGEKLNQVTILGNNSGYTYVVPMVFCRMVKLLFIAQFFNPTSKRSTNQVFCETYEVNEKYYNYTIINFFKVNVRALHL